MVIVSHRLVISDKLRPDSRSWTRARSWILGPHDALLERCSIYRQLWTQQNRHLEKGQRARHLSVAPIGRLPEIKLAARRRSRRGAWRRHHEGEFRDEQRSASKQCWPSIRRPVRAARTDLPVILEFQWPSTAIINAEVPRSARGIRLDNREHGRCTMVLAMWLIPVDQVVAARGVVVSQSSTILRAAARNRDCALDRRARGPRGAKRANCWRGSIPHFPTRTYGRAPPRCPAARPRWRVLKRKPTTSRSLYAGTDPRWILQVAIYNASQGGVRGEARQLSASTGRGRRR